MSQRLSPVALFVLIGATAAAGPRAVVADDDAALRTAIAEQLRPWRIEVIAEPADHGAALASAAAAGARYVIWREGSELVVLDRDTGETTRRTAPIGPLDKLQAAAAALSVKTMLRLPDVPADPAGGPATPPGPGGPAIAAHPVAGDMDPGPELRFTATTGSRFEHGLDGNVALRFGARLAVRPWPDRDWRFAVIGDFGAPAGVDQAGFHGTWWNWGALAGASWDHQIERWEVGPWIAIGIEHSTLSGTEMMTARDEEAISPALRGGAAARYRLGDFTIGGELAIEGLLTTTTYTKLTGNAQVFEIPPIGVVASLVVGLDFTP